MTTPMSITEAGGPAFLVPDAYPLNGQFEFGALGMTLRDYFAAKAMQADATNPTVDGFTVEQRASWAYAQADAMLKERQS